MNYRAEIDGLRAIAVLPVILFHAGFGLFSGGYIGVDVFFVISGYLITTIILNDLGNGRFSLISFYERRARRILPALVVVSLSATFASWIFLDPISASKVGSSAIGIASFSSNIVFWLGQGYFEEASELMPLIHTWSLAVEEQYYFLFPIMLMVLTYFGIRNFKQLFLLLAFLSFVIAIWAVFYQEHTRIVSGAFFLLPTRGWELLMGSYAALICAERKVTPPGANINRHLLSLLGLILIVVPCFVITSETPFPGYVALSPTLGTFLIIVYGSENSFVKRVLSHKVIVFLGLISYSLYLWHQPIFAFYRAIQGDTKISFFPAILLILFSFALAFLSWKFIEKPFRNGAFLSSRKIFLLSFTALSIIGAAGFATKFATKDSEFELAKLLSENDFVYFGNMDQRKFTSARLVFENRQPDVLAMGSSRLMEVGAEQLDGNVLNLSVSGASVEDLIAFVGEAESRYQLSSVYLAADPWLFNKNSRQDSWKEITALYEYWFQTIFLPESNLMDSRQLPFLVDAEPPQSRLSRLFESVNSVSLIPENEEHESRAKKASDGFHIYDLNIATRSAEQIERGFDALLNYSMGSYEYSYALEEQYMQLISFLKARDIEVTIVLTPYHPDLYERILSEKPIYQEIERAIRVLGNEARVGVLGSYDPNPVGCRSDEFYDGMHPKSSCMKKVISYIQ